MSWTQHETSHSNSVPRFRTGDLVGPTWR